MPSRCEIEAVDSQCGGLEGHRCALPWQPAVAKGECSIVSKRSGAAKKGGRGIEALDAPRRRLGRARQTAGVEVCDLGNQSYDKANLKYGWVYGWLIMDG